jgi:hypothetical protein
MTGKFNPDPNGMLAMERQVPVASLPWMLRQSTFSVADGHLKVHLEADWNEIPVEHIDIDAVNEWIWKKRQAELSWVTIKNIPRTVPRVLSCSSKGKKPPFSQESLAIPERNKLQMKIESRRAVSFQPCWYFGRSGELHYAKQVCCIDTCILC